jgi:hypothetical protein
MCYILFFPATIISPSLHNFYPDLVRAAHNADLSPVLARKFLSHMCVEHLCVGELSHPVDYTSAII